VSCSNIFVDDGKDYCRFGFMNFNCELLYEDDGDAGNQDSRDLWRADDAYHAHHLVRDRSSVATRRGTGRRDVSDRRVATHDETEEMDETIALSVLLGVTLAMLGLSLLAADMLINYSQELGSHEVQRDPEIDDSDSIVRVRPESERRQAK
jgi:hypothetical protein